MATDPKSATEQEATRRGRLKTDQLGEFHFDDTLDAVKFVSGQVRQSSMKYKDVASGHMSTSTVSNMASGKTHYPRFSTMAGILGALGLEVVFRGRRK